MNLLQVAAGLGRNGIANVMRGIAGAWSGDSTFAVFDGAGDSRAWEPSGLWARRRLMAVRPGPVTDAMEAMMRDREIGAVLAHYPPLDRPAFRAADRLGLPKLDYYHNVTPLELSAPAEVNRRRDEDASMLSLLKEADGVLVNSRYTADKVRRETGVEAVVASPAVDTDRFTPFDRPDDGVFRIVHVGRAVPHKGVRELLANVLPLIRDRNDIRFDYIGGVGDDDYGGYCRELLSDPAVTWHRDLDDDGLVRRLAEADVFVSGSRFEGFGMPFLEAAACGTPSLGFDCAAIPEAVIDGVTGRLVAENDWEAFLGQLDTWMRDPAELAGWRPGCRAHAEGRGWDQVASAVDSALRAKAR